MDVCLHSVLRTWARTWSTAERREEVVATSPAERWWERARITCLHPALCVVEKLVYQSNLWYISVYINKTVQKITILSFNICIWFYLNLHRILKNGITLPYWSLFSLNMSVVIPSICNFRKCEFNGCIIFKKIGDLCEHFMQKWTQ